MKGTIARVVIAVLLVAPCCCVAAARQTIGGKGFTVEYRESGGARVTLGGVPVIRASSIQLHAPDWKKGYYSSNTSQRTFEVDAPNRTITVRHAADKHVKFAATETYRITDDTIEITLSGQLDTDVPAQLEWAIGYLNAFALYGGSYAPGDKPGPAVPVVPMASLPRDDPAVVKDAVAIDFSTRAGGFSCRVDAPALSLLDGRLAPNRWWPQESPTLWLGRLNVPVKPGEPFELKVVMTFTPAAPVPAVEPSTLATELTKHPRVFDPPERPFQVIPKPRQMVLQDARIVLPPEAIISAYGEGLQAGKLLSRELNERFNLKTRAAGPSEFFANEPEIGFVEGSRDAIKPEGYTIRCNTDGIEIKAIDANGFRYAAQTLLQLVRPMPDGAPGAYVPACEIDDEPSLAFRGVHLFPGKDSLDFHRRLVENVIARHKFNHVVLECEYTQWDSARGVWVDFSVPKQQIKEYVKLLRDNGLEPIPLVQSLGHCGWMFKNDQNLDLAEDPAVPRAYDATNPKTYAFIDRVYEEALELFGNVKYFHIGHDEVSLFGKYPNREESKRWGVTKLFLHDVDHWKRFFEPRGVRLMMWGDMLLAREEIKDGAAFGDSLEEARARRAGVPKDAVICDWHYDDTLGPDDYSSLKIFKDAGFAHAVASTWFKPMNIHGFAEAARRNGAWGLLQTTWAGYNLDESALDREFKQFSAYLLAAEYAWSADSPPPDKLPWRADEVLIRALDPTAEMTAPRAGFIARLPPRHGPGEPLTVDRVGGFKFGVRDCAVVLGGALAAAAADAPLPQSVTMKFSSPAVARDLAFLHATAFPADQGEEVGRYEVHYSDGATERIPLRYGEHIRAWSDPAVARRAPSAHVAKNEAGLTIAARAFVWTNPHPDKPIASITFMTDHPYASPALLGLCGIDGGGGARR